MILTLSAFSLIGFSISSDENLNISNSQTLRSASASELWNPEHFFTSSTWSYNADLAYVAIETCDQSKGENEMIQHYKSLGFDEKCIKTQNYAWPIFQWLGKELGCHGIAVKEYDSFNLMVITVRGSKSLREIKSDATAIPDGEFWGYMPYNIIRDIYDGVMGTIKDVINEHSFLTSNGKKTKIMITGHSLGGASANLLGANFDNLARSYGDYCGMKFEIDDIYCYTFGAINSIGNKYYNNSPSEYISELPVEDGYENIHNIYNYYDTFGPKKAGNVLPNGIGNGVQKFGIFHCFSKNFTDDSIMNAKGHLESTYRDAVYNQIVDEKGSSYIYEYKADNFASSENAQYTVLILDTSGSMSGTPIAKQKEAATSFCETLINTSSNNYVSIITFSSSSSVKCDFTNDISTLKSIINSTGASGGTNTNAALVSAGEKLKSVNDGNANKIIVLCSDGLPESGASVSDGKYTASDYSGYGYANAAYNTAIELKKNYEIYTLGFFHSLTGNNLTFGQKFMSDLQNEGYYNVNDPEQLTDVFEDIAKEIVDPGTSMEKLLEKVAALLKNVFSVMLMLLQAALKAFNV